jgi:hypothetical protein
VDPPVSFPVPVILPTNLSYSLQKTHNAVKNLGSPLYIQKLFPSFNLRFRAAFYTGDYKEMSSFLADQ